MRNFEDYRSDTGFNNLVVRRALGEIDTEVLAIALAALSDKTREVFYRNMSGRSTIICKEVIESKGRSTGKYLSTSSIGGVGEVWDNMTPSAWHAP